MKKFPWLILLFSSLAAAVSPNDNGPPQFQVQIQNAGGTIVDPLSRDWTLLNSTDSVNSFQGGTWTTGRTWSLTSGADSVSVVQSTSPWVTTIPDKNVTGTVAALNATVSLTTTGLASVIVTVNGTWSANLAFQGFDGTNWINASGLTVPSGGITTSLSANGSALINVGGFSQFRILASSYTSGTANIFMNAGAGPSVIEVYNDSQNPLISKVTDGTNNITVKPASTAAVAADTALVVAISPNNTISTTSRVAITANAPTNVSVGVATGALVAANASRKGLIVMNLSSSTVSLGIGASAVLNSGITLYPGGTWTMDEFSFNVSAVNAIAGAAASSVAFQEFQ